MASRGAGSLVAVALVAFVVAASANTYHISPSLLLAWRPTATGGNGPSTVLAETSLDGVMGVADAALGRFLPGSSGNKAIDGLANALLAGGDAAAGKTVIIALVPDLRTDRVEREARLVGAGARPLSTLEAMMAADPSAVVARNVVLGREGQAVASRLAAHLSRSHESITVLRATNDVAAAAARAAPPADGVIPDRAPLSLEGLTKVLGETAEAGLRRVALIEFAPATPLAEVDAQLAALVEATTPDLAVVTSTAAVASSLVTSWEGRSEGAPAAARYTRHLSSVADELAAAGNATNVVVVYFTPSVWMGIFVSAWVGGLLSCGLCCMFGIQTQEVYETPKRRDDK